MNTKRIYMPVLLCAMLAAVCLSACSTDDAVPSPGDGSSGLRFSVNGVQTRLGYNFEHTTFDDGETIGCVIAEVNGGTETFLCNSKWTYRANDGMLILQEDNDYVAKDQSDESLLTLVDEAKTLKFCFYYPYVDGSLLQDDYKKVVESSDGYKYKLLEYPNCATAETTIPSSAIDYNWNSITLVGEVSSADQQGYNGDCNKYGWSAYPCFVNHTQGDITAAGENNDKRLQNSDFLWGASPDINMNVKRTVNLYFKKKTATILVYSETQLDDVYFAVGNGEGASLIRGNYIDLATGTLGVYDDPDPYYEPSVQKKAKYFNSDERIVPCYRGLNVSEGSNYYFYRIVLPAQTGCNFKMHIKIGDTVDKDINLSEDNNLTELKEGYLYSIRISKDGRTVIRINDWKDGEGGTLEELPTTEP